MGMTMEGTNEARMLERSSKGPKRAIVECRFELAADVKPTAEAMTKGAEKFFNAGERVL